MTIHNQNQYIKDYFRFSSDPVANPGAVVSGKNFRFTVLTSRLIRIEYTELGAFEDRASQTFWYRNQPIPEFQVSRLKNILTIETDHLVLKYNTQKKFSWGSLSVHVKKMKKTWHYGDKERGNLRGTYRTLDAKNGACKLEKGLMSKDGYTTVDDSKSLVFNDNSWLIPRNGTGKDLYFFGYGRDYLDCLSDYYKISGKTPMIPRYILGNWWSRYWKYDEAELKELIENFEKYEMPFSVCIIDMDWHLVAIDKKYGRGWTGYTWNKELFPDPKGMLDWLHDKNLKVSMNLHPAAGIKGHEECYPAVADFMGVDKANEEPVDFDIADPKFVSAYFDLVHHPHEEQGVDFWWIDWQQGKSSKIKGLDPLWMLNHLHFHDLGRDGSKRPFIFSRWGQRGNHRYPIGFSGDTFTTWRSLAFQPYFTSTASNIGYGWWSHDIGGHMLGKDDAELYTRWVQFGVFSPINRLHSSKLQFLKREPWRYDTNTVKHAGDAMRLRHALIPYIYTMAYRNFAEDIPLMLPLYYAEPNTRLAYKYKNEYWFGSEMVVAPVIKKMDPRTQRVLQKVYLPEADSPYFNFFNKEKYEAGTEIIRAYDVSEIPVFVKAGGIIPLSEGYKANGSEIPVRLKVEIFPGKSNTFNLYEDEGNTVSYREGENYITAFTLSWEKTVKFSIDQPAAKKPYIPQGREFTLSFNAIKKPENIVVTSDTGVKHEVDYDQKQSCLKVRILSVEFNHLEVSFIQPEIINRDMLKDSTYRMLDNAPIRMLRKEFIFRRHIKNGDPGEALLKKVFNRIKLSFI